MRAIRIFAICCLFAASAIGLAFQPSGAAGAKTAKPKLAVIVVFDQLRADMLEKWKGLFGEGGFKRLQTEGAWFTNCHYPYSDTYTAPGHASIATGCSPDRHGIIDNEWYDRHAGEEITSVQSERYDILFTPRPKAKEPEPKNDKKKSEPVKKPFGASPLRRREETIADVLYRLTQGRSKIASLSIKDRAAILLAALRAQIVYWFSTSFGGFVTSTYYNDAMHPWVNDFNRKNNPDQWFGKSWQRLRSDLDYLQFSGADDVAVEGIGYDQGRAFPHEMKGGLDKAGKKFYEAVTNSPYGNELLLDLAKKALDAERLGTIDVPDMLCLSFSSNDLIGHCWGPDSQEVLDMTLRTDLMVKDLLDTLDAKVGKGQYILVVTADHGICPMPEVAKSQGKDAGRVSPELLQGQAAQFLQERFAKDQPKLPWVEGTSSSWIYLNKGVLRQQALSAAEVEKALAEWLSTQPGVQTAFTRTQLLAKPGDKEDAIAAAVRLSFHPDVSGDVKVVLKPNYLFSLPLTSTKTAAYRTTHGSPHPYDTHVPLFVFGQGVKPGVRNDRVTPLATAAILARSLQLPLPSAAEAPLPDGLFER